MRKIILLSAAVASSLALSACVAPVKYKSLELANGEPVPVARTIAQPTVISTSTVAAIPQETFIIRGTSFALDSDRLLASGRNQLEDVASTMLRSGGSFNIVGYASTEGNDNYNLNLSERRARSVASYLVSRGVPSGSLFSSGAGETTEFGSDLASNRRVQISQLSSGPVQGTVISSTPILGSSVVNGTPVYTNATVTGTPVYTNNVPTYTTSTPTYTTPTYSTGTPVYGNPYNGTPIVVTQ